MGIAFFEREIGVNGPEITSADAEPLAQTQLCATLRTGDMIYVAGRIGQEDRICPHCGKAITGYYIQGIYTHVELAVENCLDETYFVGPLPLNVALPHDIIEWHGLIWPFQPVTENHSDDPAPDDGNPDSGASFTDPLPDAASPAGQP